MYSRGGLYDQAIAELRAALADDPQRPDLMVLLAQMYFYLGQQVEAVDTCGNIMKRLPYCLVANRILASILPQTGRADDTKTYHQRVIAMDPYFASASANSLSADSVSESAINIERLAYRPGQPAGGPAQPAWAASLGIAFEESQADQLPEWLQDQSSLETASKQGAQTFPTAPFSWETAEDEKAPPEKASTFEDIIPDWMKEAGWQPATSAAAEEQVRSELEFPSEQPEGELAKAEIPDWLKGLAPSGALDEEPTLDLSGQEGLDLPWLQKNPPGASDTIVDWLGSQKQAAQAPTEPEASPQAEINLPGDITDASAAPGPAVSGEESGLPDWLQGVESSYGRSGITDWLKTSHVDELETQKESTAEEPAQPAEELPDWLKEMGVPSAELASVEPTAEEPALPAEELPDWLKEMGEPVAELAPIEPVTEKPTLPAEGLPDWLQEMREPAAELAPAEPTVEEPALPAEKLPDWLKEMGEPATELAPLEEIAEEPALPTVKLPDWLQEMGEPAAELAPEEPVAVEPALPAGVLPEWLQEISEPSAEITPIEPAAEARALPAEELPDWLKEMGEPAAEITPIKPVAEELALPAEELPDWLKGMGEPAAELAPMEEIAEKPTLPDVELPAWLQEMGEPAAELAPAEPADEEPALPSDELPDWLKEMGEPAAELAPVEPAAEEPALPSDELPDWLKGMGEPAAELAPMEEIAEEPALPAEVLPDWLKEMGEPAAELVPPEPTAEETALPAVELPEWIEEINEPAAAIESLEPEVEELIPPLGDIPYWLKETAKITPAELNVLPIEPAAETPTLPEIELPDWSLDIGQGVPPTVEVPPIGSAGEDIDQESALPVEELPNWLKEMGEPGTESLTPFSDQTDQDAALSWLEALAAKHGAQEEELITRPEERQETMPDWIKLEAEQAQLVEPIPTQPAAHEEPTLPAVELPDWLMEIAEPAPEPAPIEPALESPTPLIDQSDQDAALAWLEKLAAQHGAKEEELITRPEERREIIPDWVKLGAEEAQHEEQLPTQPAEIEEPALPAEELPAWLKEIAEPSAELASAQLVAEEPGLPAEEPALPSAELPEWLQEMAEPAAELAPADPGTDITTAAIDLTDQDAALAWLEGLAAQHGAREEELITRPEERLETMPDWIKQEAESSITEEETPTQPIPVEASASSIPEIEEPGMQVEQLTEILKEMAEPVLELAPVEEPAQPVPDLPDWLAETDIPTEAGTLPEEQAEAEQLPDWLIDTLAPEPELPGERLAGGIEELPDWLKDVDTFAADEADTIPSAELPATPAWMPEAILPETELPTPPAYVPQEQPTPSEIQAELPALEPEPLPSELESELVNLNTASLSQLEHLPGIGFVTAQNIIAYRETYGLFGTIDDLAQVTGIEPALIEQLSPQLTTGIPELTLEAEPAVETEETIFSSARQAIEQGNVSHASDLYNRLVAQRARSGTSDRRYAERTISISAGYQFLANPGRCLPANR